MKAPKCPTCGELHWDRVCPNPPHVPRPSAVATPVKDRVVPCPECRRLRAEVAMLQGEITSLKLEFARRVTENAGISVVPGGISVTVKRKRGRPKSFTALSVAERARRHRAKRKA